MVSHVCAAWDPDPERYQEDIDQFVVAYAENLVANAILCVGSSSMRMWDSRIHEDLAPMSVISRGFGGSQLCDVNYYFDELIAACKPRAIVLYEGDNDIAVGKPVEQIEADFKTFQSKVSHLYPGIRVYIISVKPSTKRWEMWPQYSELNAKIRAMCEANPLYRYIDMEKALLNTEGKPLDGIFLEDGLHLNNDGYDLWAEAVRAVVEPIEALYE